MHTRVLVAGIGNIFFRDDGFGPAVADAMLSRPARPALPEGVRVVDYGIRGMHLTYDLLDGVDALVLVDTVPASRVSRGAGRPGSVAVLHVGPGDLGVADFDAHGMQPESVLASLASMGGVLPPTYVVGCVPADISEGMGLSEPVAAAITEASAVVTELARELVQSGASPIAKAGD